MSIETLRLVFFSPTGTTRSVVEAIGAGIGLPVTSVVDLTLPEISITSQPGGDGGTPLTIVGTPVYGGRVPEPALDRLRALQAKGAPVVAVVTYGNRAYEDALRELARTLQSQGLICLAAGAFIGEHSFSTAATPLSAGRPDADDEARAQRFGQRIRQKVTAWTGHMVYPRLTVPGHADYRERKPLSIVPAVHAADCQQCGACAKVCPTAAIQADGAVTIDATRCIQCCACVRACPSGALVMDDPGFVEICRRLASNCTERREPEVFL